MRKFRKYFHPSLLGPLLGGLLLSGAIAGTLFQYLKESEMHQLNHVFQMAEHVVDEVLDSYVFALHSVRAAYATKQKPLSAQEFKTLFQGMEGLVHFPGAWAFSFVRIVHPEDLSNYIKSMRQQYGEFSIQYLNGTNPERRDHFIVDVVEPIEQFRYALGFDVGSEAVRRATAMVSLDSGRPVLSPKIDLLKNNINHGVGFAFYLPVYKGVPATPEERRRQAIGWAYMPISLKKLTTEIYDHIDPNLNLVIYDREANENLVKISGAEISNAYDSGLVLSKNIKVGGREWMIFGELKGNSFFKWTNIFPLTVFGLLSVINFLSVALISKSYFLHRRAEKVVKEKTEELDRKTDDMATILNNVPCLIAYWDKNLINRHANVAYAKNLGLTPDEIRGRSIQDVLGEKFVARARKRICTVLESGTPQRFENSLKSKDGVEWQALIEYVPDFESGLVRGFFVIATDITELKKSQKEREEFQAKMVASSRLAALGEMAGGVAHEINNPLAIIQLRTEMIRRRLQKGDLDSSAVDGEIDKITETILRISRIVKSLKSLARTGDQDAFEMTSLDKIMDDTLDLCQERFKNHDVQLIVPDFSNFYLECRPTQISQVLINILNNAFDAVVKLSDRWVAIEVSEVKDNIRLAITDSGLGISDDIADKLMQPFFTTKRIGEGTGLGLSISKRILDAHKGVFYLDRTAKNTCFVVEIPKIHNSNEVELS